MLIKKGSSLEESGKAIITETKFHSGFSNAKLLLLEGPDDIEVINNYYLYTPNPGEKDFRLVKANDEDLEDKTSRAGKKNALQMFEKLKDRGRNVICLLDRDYDFHLNEQSNDPDVLYYDYYELENYILEDSLLKVAIKNLCDYPSHEVYEEIIVKLHEIEVSCESYMLLAILREINYRKDILTTEQLDKVLSILNVKISSIMLMNNLDSQNRVHRIDEYIEKQLTEVGLSIKRVREIIFEYEEFEFEKYFKSGSPLDLFKYSIKGKTFSNSFSELIKLILENHSDLQQYKSKGNLSNLNTRLKIEWIPSLSKDFAKLMLRIESKFA